MNNLILIRHGQSRWNKEKRFTGWADIDLTNKGRKEAEFAGNLVKKLNIEFDKYFTSQLVRAVNTLKIILEVINKSKAKITKSVALNERHYGGLTGLNKDDTIKKFGNDQVQIWRRSFDIPPPKMESDHPYINKINSNIRSESLKDTFNRVIPYYEEKIEPLIYSNKNILISFHGNSCRALLMKLFKIPKEKIVNLEIPTGNPILITFDSNHKIKKFKFLDSKRATNISVNF